MEFSFDHAIDYLLNEDIDFIATVTSNWHAVGVDAFLYDLSKKVERKLKGLIVINYHVKTGLYINENDFFCTNFANVQFYYLKDPKFNLKGSLEGFKNLLLSKNKNKKSIHIISVIEPSFSSFQYFKDKPCSRKYDPEYILIDEGFGTYVSKKTWKSAIDHDYNFKYRLQSIIRVYLVRTFLSFIKKFFFNILFQVKTKFIFKKKSKILTLNSDIVQSYKSVLNMRNKNLKINCDWGNENYLVLATGPLSEYNMVSPDIEIGLINAITAISRKKGINVVIKPHPRELSGKYSSIDIRGVKIINNDFPLEDWLAGSNPICIIGYASTVLVNAKIFYGIDSFNISDIAYKKTKNKSLIQQTADFKLLTSKFIPTISDLSEIEDFLD